MIWLERFCWLFGVSGSLALMRRLPATTPGELILDMSTALARHSPRHFSPRVDAAWPVLVACVLICGGLLDPRVERPARLGAMAILVGGGLWNWMEVLR